MDRRESLVNPGNRYTVRVWWGMLSLVRRSDQEEVMIVPLGVPEVMGERCSTF